MSDRDLGTSRKQVFGTVDRGTECRVCGRDVDDGRMVYCSEYCTNLADAVMGMLNWGSVRRRIVDRDDKTCQNCGFDRRYVEKGQEHLKDVILSKLPERPKSPSMLAAGGGEVSDEDWSEYFEAEMEWCEKRDALEERYGDMLRYDAPALEVDHIVPISEGGHPFDPANLQTLCTDCHNDKSAEEAARRAERRAEERTTSRPEIEAELADYITGGGADT